MALFLLLTPVFVHPQLSSSKHRKITKVPKTGEEYANCIFSDKEMPKGEEDKFDVKTTMTCGEYKDIHVRCYSPKVFSDYKPDETQYFAKTSFGEAWMWNSVAHQTNNEYLVWDTFRFHFYGSESDFKWMYGEYPQASWHCDQAKKEGLKEFTITVVVKVLKKVGSDFKTEWDDVQKAYVTKEIPKYGEGKDVSTGDLKILVPDSYKPVGKGK